MAIIIPIYGASGSLEISDNFDWFIDGTIGYLTNDGSECITPLSIKDNETGMYYHVWHLRKLASSSYSLSSHLAYIRSLDWAKVGTEQIFER